MSATSPAWVKLGVTIFLACASCGGDDDVEPRAATTTSTGEGGSLGLGGAGQGAGTTSSAHGGGTSTSTNTGGAGPVTPSDACRGAAPSGATHAPPLPAYSGGACPALVAGKSSIATAGGTRSFVLAVPANLDPAERLPVVFLWHWLGGSADDFYSTGAVQEAVDHYRFLAVIPEAKGDVNTKWPFDVTQSEGRIGEELGFFDDMLACVGAQYSIVDDCVASAGVSAGALFTGVLAGRRGDRISSFISLSGGTGGYIKPWKEPPHAMPAMVLWGGPGDACLSLNFQTTSLDLEQGLTSGGHFLVECVHNCGHAEPPFDAPNAPTKFAPLWEFFLEHPFWLGPGESPFSGGLPGSFPDWCAVGKGSATPRQGACSAPSGC